MTPLTSKIQFPLTPMKRRFFYPILHPHRNLDYIHKYIGSYLVTQVTIAKTHMKNQTSPFRPTVKLLLIGFLSKRVWNWKHNWIFQRFVQLRKLWKNRHYLLLV